MAEAPVLEVVPKRPMVEGAAPALAAGWAEEVIAPPGRDMAGRDATRVREGAPPLQARALTGISGRLALVPGLPPAPRVAPVARGPTQTKRTFIAGPVPARVTPGRSAPSAAPSPGLTPAREAAELPWRVRPVPPDNKAVSGRSAPTRHDALSVARTATASGQEMEGAGAAPRLLVIRRPETVRGPEVAGPAPAPPVA